MTAMRTMRLGADLKGVAGFTGGGDVLYTEWSDGRRRIEADLAGVAGLKAEIVVKGALVGALPCREGVVAGRLETARGAPIPTLADGDAVEIRQNGVAILKGALRRG